MEQGLRVGFQYFGLVIWMMVLAIVDETEMTVLKCFVFPHPLMTFIEKITKLKKKKLQQFFEIIK